jgi:hypothetical protein
VQNINGELFLFFTLLSSTFPLIRGKRSEFAMHKIVKIVVARLLAGFQPAVVTLFCFIGRCPTCPARQGVNNFRLSAWVACSLTAP